MACILSAHTFCMCIFLPIHKEHRSASTCEKVRKIFSLDRILPQYRKEFRFLHCSGVIFRTFSLKVVCNQCLLQNYIRQLKIFRPNNRFHSIEESKEFEFTLLLQDRVALGEKTALENLRMHFTSGALGLPT